MNKKGITLLSLVATVVIMLLLAGVTFGAIRGGLFSYAGKAKTGTEESSIKQGIQQAFILAKGDSKTNKVSEQNMQHQVDLALPDKNATVVEEGDKLIVIIDNKYYEVDNNGGIAGPGKLEPIVNAGDITKGGTCTGTEDKPYRIECIEDLVELSKRACNNQTIDTAKYYLLTKDLDFNSIFSYSDYKAKYSYDSELNAYVPDENSTTTIKQLCTTGQGFIPISLAYGSDGQTRTFRGTFYGDEQRTIKNIFINRNGNAALFGGCSSAKIKKITINGDITSLNGIAAGFIGGGWSCTIQDCENHAKITSKTSQAAGIQASGGKGNIINCVNRGEIISEGGCASGIAHFIITLDKCKNFGRVTGKTGAAGIGTSRYGGDTGVMTNCYNAGEIICNGTGAVGGLALACHNKNKIYNSYNVGILRQENAAKPTIGGVCGATSTGENAVNCYSKGEIITKEGANVANCGVLMKTGESVKNGYYLDGIEVGPGITPETSAHAFVKTSADEEALTTAKVVAALNSYIESNEDGINTTGWCKWEVDSDNLPVLDFDTEWNGTSWVTVSN